MLTLVFFVGKVELNEPVIIKRFRHGFERGIDFFFQRNFVVDSKKIPISRCVSIEET